MPYVMFSIVVLMIGKDTFQLGDPYFMRGGAQILALLVAIGALVYRPPVSIFSRYWPLLGYMGSMLLTSIQSSIPTFVILQIGSLGAILLFAIAYFDEKHRVNREAAMIKSVIGVYFCTALASLVVAKFASDIAYETLYAGDNYGNELRFRGLFSKSAMMGAAGGILVGSAWFGIRNPIFRLLIIVPGLICMGLTLSRTFWLATFGAGAVTAWYYHPSRAKFFLHGTGVILLLAIALGGAKIAFNQKEISHALRTHTITNLTGRVDIWERGLRALENRPWFGYGFTFGSEGLQAAKNVHGGGHKQDARTIAKISLHNGYMQSFLDSGIIGTAFYVATIVISIVRLIKWDKERRFPSAFYCLTFLVIANFGESIIYSASVFHSVLFWLLAAFSLGLKETKRMRVSGSRSMLLDHRSARLVANH